MIKVVISVLWAVGCCMPYLFAPCMNNSANHVKTIVMQGTQTQHYTCAVKSPAFYKNKKIRLSFYKNNKCVVCGCSGEMHTDGVPFEQKRRPSWTLEGGA